MCGICGVVSMGNAPPLNEEHLTRMRDSLLHRGPDDAGNYLGPGAALASRRLAILDLSPKGHMPMTTEDGRYQIVYNGEVYNFEDLRDQLIRRGIPFRSGTDTEVILKLFALDGPAMLHQLNGMFAIAIWDTRERSLFLARDRLGVKPLYYVTQREKFYFASEEKAFFAAGLSAKFDSTNLEELIYFHYIAGGKTPFEGVRRLLPGHFLIWQQGKIQISRWWNLAEKARQLRGKITDPPAWLRSTFDDAVRLRRISDVPVGVFLSGGLDSSSVVASMALENSTQVSTFTIGFEESAFDESGVARLTASQYKTNHHELKVPLAKLADHLIEAARFLGEPMAHASDIHLWMIAAYAKNKATVLLSGEGADESMAGYGWYRLYQLLPVLKRFRAGASMLQKLHPKFHQLDQFLSLRDDHQLLLRNFSDHLPDRLAAFGLPALQGPFEYRQSVLREAAELYPEEPVRQAMYYDQHTYLCSILDRNDKMTMAASVECRTPFLDYRLIEGLASLPTHQLLQGWKTKPLLRRALGARLPSALQRQKKRGFDVPWPRYLREHRGLKERVLQLPQHPFWGNYPIDKKRMTDALSAFMRGDETHARLIWHLSMVVIWYDSVLKQAQEKK